MKVMIWSIKGYKKRGGGYVSTDIAPSLLATDYKEPNLVIEYEDTTSNEEGIYRG